MTYVNRTVTFIDEGIQRTGIVTRQSLISGSMVVNVTDGIDDTRQIIVGNETPVQLVPPAHRDTIAILNNAPRCQIESDGDMLWA